MAKRAVLVVEDDDVVQVLLRTMVRRHDAAVELAGDGQTTIDMLRAGAFDTVILDLMLPRVNGFQVAEAIRALERPPKLIVMSALARYFGDRFPEGTVMMQKPFDLDRLDAALRVANP